MNESRTNQRVVTFLNREEIDFLDKLGKDALFSTGTKISRARLIAWLIDLLKGLGIDGKNISSERDLEERILEVLRQLAQEGSVPASHGRNIKSTQGKGAARHGRHFGAQEGSVPTRHGRIGDQAAETEVSAANHGRPR